MELIFATVIGCTLSFLCGAAACCMKEFLTVGRSAEKENDAQMDPKMQKQWESFLNYDGEEV